MTRRLLPLLALLATLACDRSLALSRQTVYVPWEEGLTLVYENPALPAEARFQERLQRRVAASTESPAGRRITLTTSSLKSNSTADFLSKDGGWVKVEGDRPLLAILPEGFPDRMDRWEDKQRGVTFKVIGRAQFQSPDLKLPVDFNRTGVWVETEAKDGSRLRSFFLPNIGEVESQVYQGGQWVAVSRLAFRSFSDLPVAQPAP